MRKDIEENVFEYRYEAIRSRKKKQIPKPFTCFSNKSLLITIFLHYLEPRSKDKKKQDSRRTSTSPPPPLTPPPPPPRRKDPAAASWPSFAPPGPIRGDEGPTPHAQRSQVSPPPSPSPQNQNHASNSRIPSTSAEPEFTPSLASCQVLYPPLPPRRYSRGGIVGPLPLSPWVNDKASDAQVPGNDTRRSHARLPADPSHVQIVI